MATGPKSKTGGFNCDIQMRNDSDIHTDAIRIVGREKDGILTLTIFANDAEIFSRTTKR